MLMIAWDSYYYINCYLLYYHPKDELVAFSGLIYCNFHQIINDCASCLPLKLPGLLKLYKMAEYT